MPIYEYRCRKGHTFDITQRFSDEPLTRCEICGAAAQRVLHAPAVHFKGSGFYNTDYGTRKRSREMKEQQGKEGKESKEGAKSESASSSSSSSGDSGSSSSAKESGGSASSSSTGEKKAKAKTAD